MKYELSLIGRRYAVSSPDLGTLSVAEVPFLRLLRENEVPENGENYGSVCFSISDRLPKPPQDAALYEDVLFAPSMAHVVWYCSGAEHLPIAAADFSLAPDIIQIIGLSAYADRLCRSRYFTRLLCVEKIINAAGGLLLHASLIATPQGGIVFAGESGVGKSTQAALWEACTGAEILNGDRAGIIPENGHWMGYGLPMAGSSEIYKNRGIPISAVILLRQAQDNTVTPMKSAAAFAGLYPQVNVHRWDRQFGMMAADNLIRLLEAVPAYELACRPDTAAVELLKMKLFGF